MAIIHDKPLGTLSAIISQRPDIVLMEIAQPTRGGEEIAGVVRKNRLLSNVQVIFYSTLDARQLAAAVQRNQVLGSIDKSSDARGFAQQFKELTSRLA